MIKRIRIIFSLCLIVLLCSACREVTDKSNGKASVEGHKVLVGDIDCDFPLVDDDTTLNILSCAYSDFPYEDVLVWKKYEEMTGVKVNWTSITKEERQEKVKALLMNQSKTDLIIRCKIDANKQMQYGQNGLILDLTKDDLLKKNAPNCWAYLQSHKETFASIMNPDGSIYSIPQVNSGAELRVSRKIFINKNWLAKVGMELPKTTEDFYKILKAFREQDANGNGDPTDEIPLCPLDWMSIQDSLFGAFGLANRGTHNTIVDCDPTTGNARFIASSDAYQSLLAYLNQLYTNGLLDPNYNTITLEQWTNNLNKDCIGVFFSTNLALLPPDSSDDWVAVPEALEGPNGDKLWTAIRADFHSTGAAVIPATCSNPSLVLQWLDFFWTDQGTLFYHMGEEGNTYHENKDGTFDYSDSIYKKINSGDYSFDDVISQYSPYPGGSNPTVEVAPYFMGGEVAELPATAARSLFEYGPEEYWPSFTFTPEESDSLNTISLDLNKYIEDSRYSFITGQTSLEQWSEYINHLKLLKSDEVCDIYQNAIDRYHKMQE